MRQSLKKRCSVYMELRKQNRFGNVSVDTEQYDPLVKILDAGEIMKNRVDTLKRFFKGTQLLQTGSCLPYIGSLAEMGTALKGKELAPAG